MLKGVSVSFGLLGGVIHSLGALQQWLQAGGWDPWRKSLIRKPWTVCRAIKKGHGETVNSTALTWTWDSSQIRQLRSEMVWKSCWEALQRESSLPDFTLLHGCLICSLTEKSGLTQLPVSSLLLIGRIYVLLFFNLKNSSNEVLIIFAKQARLRSPNQASSTKGCSGLVPIFIFFNRRLWTVQLPTPLWGNPLLSNRLAGLPQLAESSLKE